MGTNHSSKLACPSSTFQPGRVVQVTSPNVSELENQISEAPKREECIERFVAGDPNALMELWTGLAAPARSVLAHTNQSMGGQTHTDVLQNSLVSIWRHYKQFDGSTRQEWNRWALAIVRNEWLGMIRWNCRKIRNQSKSTSFTDESGNDIPIADREQATPSECARANELESLLNEFTSQMSEADQVLLFLRDKQELTYDEIALETSSNTATVFRNLQALKNKLSCLLKAHGYDAAFLKPKRTKW